MAKGYTQEEGIDFSKTFFPVLKIVIVYLLLAIAALKGWSYSNLMSTMLSYMVIWMRTYMAPPPFLKGDSRVCRLHKSLYELK